MTVTCGLVMNLFSPEVICAASCVGVSPAAYHLSLRLGAARLTLRQPGFDVTKTAQQHGFSSSQHFSTLFRRAYGVTPREWRSAAAGGSK